MPPKKTRKSTANQFASDMFLRSINLRYDAEEPDRIAHFHPTAKSVALLKALLAEDSDRAFFVVAPYGTGKSLTATYLLHLVENRPESGEALKTIGKKLSNVSPEFSSEATKRLRKKQQGLVLALHGYYSSLPAGIKVAAVEAMKRQGLSSQLRVVKKMPCETMNEAIDLILALKAKCSAAGFERIVVLWDEAGRHIESLITEGRTSALADIQLLAEFVTRSKDMPMVFGLILHQGLLHYAAQMSQTVRSEWTKIEGRFQTIQYVDDSKEIYRLIAEVIEANRGDIKLPAKKRISAAVSTCEQLGLFNDFIKTELKALLARAYPLEPIVLYLLPRISARVAQNERTLFTFLYGIDLNSPVDSQDLFDYFSPAMRSDTAVGGTHRQWLETQSALSKVSDDVQETHILKTACLLGLGTSGERSRAGRDLLLFALNGYQDVPLLDTALDDLMERKLLLYRKHSDEVSVWHGTDADLRGRLAEEQRRCASEFDLVDFLTKDAGPPAWKPLEYNSAFGVCRYWAGRYMTADELEVYLGGEVKEDISPGCDGKIIYVVTENPAELRKARKLAKEVSIHPQVVLAIPKEPLPLCDAAMEVRCLTQMQFDTDLLGTDPLILPELQQMEDDSRGHLQRLIDQLLRPNKGGSEWFYRGERLSVQSPRSLRRALSKITLEVFSKTPKIHNELIVRKKPSGTIINSRKKFVMGILERHGRENLGIKGNFPDASMFRTVLLNTGLYFKGKGRDDGWAYASPKVIKDDPGLRKVWRHLQKFFTEASEAPKSIRTLLEKLQSPPFGLRAGLLPIFFAAGLKGFSRVISLTYKDEYVTDILPSVIEELCKKPDEFSLAVLNPNETKLKYLQGLHNCFSAVKSRRVPEADIIRLCYDAIENWKFHLPAAALNSRQIAKHAKPFQTLMARPMDPVQLLMAGIPKACGYPGKHHKKLLTAVAACKAELESITGTYLEEAYSSLRKAVAYARGSTRESVRETTARWAACFPDEFIDTYAPGITKGLLARMQMPYDDDEGLIESLSHLLVGKSIGKWDDSTVVDFNRKIHDTVRDIEEVALSADLTLSDDDPARDRLAELLRERIADLYQRATRLVGADGAKMMLDSIVLAHELGEKQHGDHARSS